MTRDSDRLRLQKLLLKLGEVDPASQEWAEKFAQAQEVADSNEALADELGEWLEEHHSEQEKQASTGAEELNRRLAGER